MIKIGRNSPCPCGSGKKFKKCCLGKNIFEHHYLCRNEARYINAHTRREVRKLARFGCSYCGCPIIEYHHIIPFNETKCHDIENLIALCPTCHKRADKKGQWSVNFVRQMRNSPYNSDVTKDKFAISTPEFAVICGNFEFYDCDELIALKDEVVLKMERTEDNIIKIYGKFYDENGNLFAVIDNNEWIVIIGEVWDIEYINSRNLIVRSSLRNIILELEVTDLLLLIKNSFFRKGNLAFDIKTINSHTTTNIKASGPTFFSSENEKAIFKGIKGGPAINLQ